MKVKHSDLKHTLGGSLFRGASHKIMVTESSSAGRDTFQRIASRRIFELVWKMQLKHRVYEMGNFYDMFQASSTTAAGAGWLFLFKSQMQLLLRMSQTVRLFPIAQDTPGPTNFIYNGYPGTHPINFELAALDECPSGQRDAFYANRFHRPTSTNYQRPAADPRLLIQPDDSKPPILLMFQMTACWSLLARIRCVRHKMPPGCPDKKQRTITHLYAKAHQRRDTMMQYIHHRIIHSELYIPLEMSKSSEQLVDVMCDITKGVFLSVTPTGVSLVLTSLASPCTRTQCRKFSP